MQKPSRSVCSNQQGIHPDLLTILQRHQQNPFRKPLSAHTREAFSRLQSRVLTAQQPVILDSGCGVGWSSILLAEQYPDHLVLGVDKSAVRLGKAEQARMAGRENLLFLRADLVDLWRLLREHSLPISRHYLFYPNPWPKKRDIMRRFYAHPVFFDLLQLSPRLEVRSNWELYVQEFAQAVQFATGRLFPVQAFSPRQVISPFEKKYLQSGHALFRLIVDLSEQG